MKGSRFVFLPLFSVALCTVSCSPKTKLNASGREPQCLKSKIEAFSKSPHSCETGATLKQYTFQNKTVYVFAPGNCGADMASPVVDEHCNDIGSLGGFAGNMKVNGEDFSSAIYVRTIWSN